MYDFWLPLQNSASLLESKLFECLGGTVVVCVTAGVIPGRVRKSAIWILRKKKSQ